MPKKWQAITWINDIPVEQHVYVSLEEDKNCADTM